MYFLFTITTNMIGYAVAIVLAVVLYWKYGRRFFRWAMMKLYNLVIGGKEAPPEE